MIDLVTAKGIAEEHINQHCDGSGGKIIVLDEYTVEKPYGWVFFYQSEAFMNTREGRYVLLGAGPVLVERDSGRLVQLAPVHPGEKLEDKLEDYEKWKKLHPSMPIEVDVWYRPKF